MIDMSRDSDDKCDLGTNSCRVEAKTSADAASPSESPRHFRHSQSVRVGHIL